MIFFIFWKHRRDQKAGMDYLKWETTLVYTVDDTADLSLLGTPTQQAIWAKEQLDLYNWWVNVRPNRADPYPERDKSIPPINHPGFIKRFFTINYGFDLSKMPRSYYRQGNEKQHEYETEDQNQLERLIKIRNTLWT